MSDTDQRAPSYYLYAPGAPYVDLATGEEKQHWTRVGSLFREGGRPGHIRLDALPTNPAWDGYLKVIPANRGGGTRRRRQTPAVPATETDSVADR